MPRLIAVLALAVATAACTDLVGIEDLKGPGDPADLPDTLAIGGQLSRDDGQFGFPLLVDTTVSFFEADGSLVQSTTSDANGTYVLAVPTSSATLAGFVHVAAAGSVFAPRRYLDNSIGLLTSFHLLAYLSTRLEEFASFAIATQTLTTGAVIVDVVDGTGATLPGAVIDTRGVGQLRYHSDNANHPSADATSTGFFGGGWVFGITPGRITISASLGARRSVDRTIDVAAGTISQLRLRVD